MRPPHPAWPFGRRLIRDESGVTAIMVGLSMTGLIGFAALGVDVGLWYADKRSSQGAADAAAYSAAIDYAAGDTTAYAAAAKAVTAQDGYTNGSGGVTVTVNRPPATGPNTANASAIEVIVQKTETLIFSKIFTNSAAVKSRAVALSGSGGDGDCVLALDSSASTGVSTADVDISGGATITLNKCGLQSNSSGPDSLVLSGGANLTAETISLVGNYTTSGGATVSASNGIATSAPAVPDPYANVSAPTPGTCAGTNSYSGGGSYTISPGTFCNGLSISGGVTVTMNPGVYIIDRGSFSLSGGSTVTGTGVTIVLTSSTGSNYATAQLSGGTNMTITAPTSGTYAGLAFFQDRNASNSGTDSFSGGSNQNITGAIYFPSQEVTYSGGTSSTSKCTHLVAWRVDYSGGATFNNTCSGTGVGAIGVSGTTLVE